MGLCRHSKPNTSRPAARLARVAGLPLDEVGAGDDRNMRYGALLMYDRLRENGIRCWKDDHDLRSGDRTDMVNRAVRVHDCILLCCSEASLTGPWIDGEFDAAIERARKLERVGPEEWLLLPLLLNDHLFDAESGHAARLSHSSVPTSSGGRTTMRSSGRTSECWWR